MKCWEYRSVNGNPLLSEAQLDALGAEGWELVTAAPRGGDCLVYLFKRPKP